MLLYSCDIMVILWLMNRIVVLLVWVLCLSKCSICNCIVMFSVVVGLLVIINCGL